MPYSSSLTDPEGEILEPLLVEILPQKKRTRPSNWTKRDILDGIFYQLKNGCNWEDLPKDLPPYSTVYWHYKQWREAGVIEQLMNVLHGQVREQVKKKLSGRRWSSSTRKRYKIPAMRVWRRKAFVSTNRGMGSSGISQSIRWDSPSLHTALERMSRTMQDCLRCWRKTLIIYSQNPWIFRKLPFC